MAIVLAGCSRPTQPPSTPAPHRSPARTCALAGTVLLEDKPVTYYGVTVTNNYLVPFHPPATPVQDRDGTFCLPRIGSKFDVFDLLIAGPGFAPKVIRGLTRDRGKQLGTIRVTRGRSIHGRVVDETGKPASDALVRIGWSHTMDGKHDLLSDLAMGNYSATTDSTGYYRIEGLSTQLDTPRLISASIPGRKSSGPRPFDHDDTIDMQIRPVGTIEGTVSTTGEYDRTKDVVEARLETDLLVRFIGVLDTDGSFRIEEVPKAHTRSRSCRCSSVSS